MPENAEFDPYEKTMQEVNRRLAVPKEPIERQARDKDAVARILAEIEEATAYHADKPEDGRRIVISPKEKGKRDAELLQNELRNGWRLDQRLGDYERFDPDTLDTGYEWKLMDFGDMALVLKKPKAKTVPEPQS